MHMALSLASTASVRTCVTDNDTKKILKCLYREVGWANVLWQPHCLYQLRGPESRDSPSPQHI